MYGDTHDERVAVLAGIASNAEASMQGPYGVSPTGRVAYLFGWQIHTTVHAASWGSACPTGALTGGVPRCPGEGRDVRGPGGLGSASDGLDPPPAGRSDGAMRR